MRKIGITGPISLLTLKDHLDIEDKYLHLGLQGTAIDNLVIGLLEKGYEVSVYTLDFDIKEPLVFRGKNLTIYMGEYRSTGRERMIDFFNHESNQIKNFILEDKPDIVHANWTYEFSIGTLRAKVPHLITFHDYALKIFLIFKDPYRLVRFLMDRWVRWTGKNFSVISPYLRDSLGMKKDRLPLIPVPFPESKIKLKGKSYPENKTIKIISMINGWSSRKNPEAGILAFNALLKQTDLPLEFHIYGRGCSYDDEGYQWITKNKLEEKVYLHGAVPYKTMMEILPEFDILLHTAIEESFGNTLIEAMAFGLPVVAGKDSGAVPWVLNNGKNGVLVDVTSAVEITNGLLKIINEPDYYEKLSNDGISYCRKAFSTASVTEAYLKIYQQILDQKR